MGDIHLTESGVRGRQGGAVGKGGGRGGEVRRGEMQVAVYSKI